MAATAIGLEVHEFLCNMMIIRYLMKGPPLAHLAHLQGRLAFASSSQLDSIYPQLPRCQRRGHPSPMRFLQWLSQLTWGNRAGAFPA
jgi:hypothetical protein